MQLKKLLALLLSAALALSLLAGCGDESVARSLLALLDGKYANVSVEMDPDLEADLRQALSETENDDEAAIRAALETLLGSTITFRYLGEGQQGDTAFDLIFYAGADPDKAAQSAYSQWNGTFSNLPDDGLYTAALAQVQTENGIWLLVQATVDKAGTVDKPDKDDDEPEDEKVEGNGFTYNVTQKTITVEPDNQDGLQELFFNNADTKVEAARADGFAGVTIELAAGSYSVKDTFGDENTPFMGTLQGKSPDEKATITLTGGKGLFVRIGEDSSGPENNGTVENITFDVETNITNTFTPVGNSCAGAVAGINYGTITNCEVKLNGHTIKASSSDPRDFVNAGGLVGVNHGTITDCTVTINGPISATGGHIANAGGIAGDNEGEIKGNSQVTIESGGSGSIKATGTNEARAGGLAGQNGGTVNVSTVDGDTYKGDDDTIQATFGESTASVPNNDSNTDKKLDDNNVIKASAGTKIGFDNGTGGPVGF